MNEQKQPAMAGQVKWLAGWYATRLHAVPESYAEPTKVPRQAICGAWVTGQPRTDWAEKRIAAGLQTCSHCRRRLAVEGEKE